MAEVVNVNEVNVIHESCDSYEGFPQVHWSVAVVRNSLRMLAFFVDECSESVELADDAMIMTALLNKDFREEQFRTAFGVWG